MNLRPVRAWLLSSSGLARASTDLGVVGALVMELAWFTPWFRYFNASAGAMGELAVLGVLLATALVAMLADRAFRERRPRRYLREAGLFLLLIAQTTILILVFHPSYPGLSLRAFVSRALGSLGDVLQVIPAELVIILGTMFAFRRGIVAGGRQALAPEAVHFRFRAGIVILAAFGLIFRSGESRLLLETLPVFFFSGLLTLTVSRIDRAPPHVGGEAGPARGTWIWAILIVILTTVVLGQSLSDLLQTRAAAEGVRILSTMGLEALRIIVILLGPLIQVVAVLITWLMSALTGALGNADGVARLIGGIESLTRALPADPTRPPTWIQAHAREIATVATGLILALLAATAIRSGRAGSRSAPAGLADEADEAPRALADRAAGPGLWNGTGRRGRKTLAALGDVLAANSIRRIYRKLLRLADSRGRGRSPAETPLEFLPVLRELFPFHQSEVGTITDAYLRVRYGGRPDEEAGLAEVKRAWAAVQSERLPRAWPPSSVD